VPRPGGGARPGRGDADTVSQRSRVVRCQRPGEHDQVGHNALDQRFPGIVTGAGLADMAALTAGKDELVAAMRAGKYADLAADYGWEIIAGTARFTGAADAPELQVIPSASGAEGARGKQGGTVTIEAAHYLVATGAEPWIPPVDGLEQSGYLTSTTAMELTELPESMVVIGGNSVGLELGQLFARLGTRDTIVEALDRLAPFEEPEISAAIEDVFDGEGIGIRTGVTVTSVRRGATGRSVSIKADGRDQELTCGEILVAAGRRPVTAGLNLEAAGVKAGARGEIITDEHQRTANPRIWAAGDVTGGPQFVYVAAAQGTRAADNALNGAGRTVDYAALPRVTFTSPAIASAGLTEAELIRAGVACDCRVVPLEAVPRAVVGRDTRGVVKLVVEAGTGRVRGAHAVAESATASRRGGRGGDRRRRVRDPRRDDRHRPGGHLVALPDHVRGTAAGRAGVHPRHHPVVVLRGLITGRSIP
jgi:mercuric reductase